MENNKCFALSEQGYCNILTIGRCTEPERCKFYKTRERVQDEEERSRNRRREDGNNDKR